MTIDGHAVIPDPGSVNHPHATGSIPLSAGKHRIVVGERNIGGDSSLHLYWNEPGKAAETIPSSALIPDRPSAIRWVTWESFRGAGVSGGQARVSVRTAVRPARRVFGKSADESRGPERLSVATGATLVP